MAALHIAQYLLSFGLVIGLLLAVLWGLKRIQSQGGLQSRQRDARIQIIETLSMGARQKVVLLRVDQRDVLLGVTPMEIRALDVTLAPPANTEEWLRRRGS
jgi:flagellar protein FliO/FliZ